MTQKQQQSLLAETDTSALIRVIQQSKNIELNIKQAIDQIGNEGQYQKLLIIYFTFCFIFATYLLFGTSYYFMNPIFICDGESATEDVACTQLQRCSIENTYTVTYQTGLYCGEKQTVRNVIQSMLGVGACLGVLFLSIVSDKKGRKFCLMIAISMGILSVVLLVIGVYAKVTSLLIISQILAGLSAQNQLTLIYVLSDKLMSKKYANRNTIITYTGFAIGEVSLILFTGIFNWKHYTFACIIPAVCILLIGIFFVVEDPVFLFTKRRYTQCKSNLKIIAIFNNKCQRLTEAYKIMDKLKENLDQINQLQNKSGTTKDIKYLPLLMKKEIIMPIICLGLFSVGGNLNYYLYFYAISEVGYSYGISIALMGGFEFLGMFPMLFAGSRIPRKLGMAVIVILQTALALIFLIDISKLLQTIIIMITRFIFVTKYTLNMLIIVETFPQHIQSSCFGMIYFISQMGKFLAPFTVRLADSLEIPPILVTAFIGLIFCLPTLIPLKQTLRKNVVDEQMKIEEKALIL